MKVLVRNIRLPFERDEREAFEKAAKRLKPLCGPCSIEDAFIYKKSLDARKKDAIAFVYTVVLSVDGSYGAQRLAPYDAAEFWERPLKVIKGGAKACKDKPVVVGFGPCGMFCALLLAENGYEPVVIERGGTVEQRTAAVAHFYRTGRLDTNCNIQFGAGGAGTFSDGKLMTRINDEKCHYILSRFHEFGAPDEIMKDAKPHIGTDRLKRVVQNIADRIEELGGTILYNTRMTGLRTLGKEVTGVATDRGEFPCCALVLAIGHSARDTYGILSEAGVSLVPKAFSVGVRIEHLQRDIDAALYGKAAGHPKLPKGEYSLSGRFEGRGVYSFCMCPGGTVVGAASEEGGVVTNGMSEYKRDGVNANSALCVSVLPEDYGGSVRAAIEFVRGLEQKAFIAGGRDYSAPVQTVGSFLGRICPAGEIKPTYMDGRVKNANLDGLLPSYVSRTLREGLLQFDRKIKGFARPDAILTGVETRTSSPLRMPRTEEGAALGFENLFPCGEGAGYAGGITSAAVDGVRCALTLMQKYENQ